MKKIIILLLISSITVVTRGQNVGIGTTTPHSSAQLQITSTTRGFLPPRMTTIQRTSISSPLNGLMVYDTDFERMYLYEDGIWRYTLDNRVWSKSTATDRNLIFNIPDSVGIGTGLPNAKLHVVGDAQVSSGDLRIVNGGLVMNATSATMSLQTGSVDKGFVQLSGDNLRVGTFSSNTNGQFIIRVGGQDQITVNSLNRVGIGTSNPTETLDVNGNINFDGRLTSTNTGNAPLTPLCWGMTNSSATGGIRRGTGNTSVSRVDIGRYRLTCPGITANSVVVIYTPLNVLNSWVYEGPDQITVSCYLDPDPTDGSLTYFDYTFTFIVF